MAEKQIILGLGSNMGDRIRHLQSAVNKISEFISIEKISSIYETPPFEMEADINFYNLCLEGKTELSADDVLTKCLQLEKKAGRTVKRDSNTFESRPLDIDILYFNGEIINDENLKIPHPEIHKRKFVLEPLNEISPEHFDPLRKFKIRELVTNLKDESIIHQIVQRIELNK